MASPGGVSILAARHADFWAPSFGRLERRGSRDIEVPPFFRWVRAGAAGAGFCARPGNFAAVRAQPGKGFMRGRPFGSQNVGGLRIVWLAAKLRQIFALMFKL